jgi:hypothetical protein
MKGRLNANAHGARRKEYAVALRRNRLDHAETPSGGHARDCEAILDEKLPVFRFRPFGPARATEHVEVAQSIRAILRIDFGSLRHQTLDQNELSALG